jgi:hypothetical protein
MPVEDGIVKGSYRLLGVVFVSIDSVDIDEVWASRVARVEWDKCDPPGEVPFHFPIPLTIAIQIDGLPDPILMVPHKVDYLSVVGDNPKEGLKQTFLQLLVTLKERLSIEFDALI